MVKAIESNKIPLYYIFSNLFWISICMYVKRWMYDIETYFNCEKVNDYSSNYYVFRILSLFTIFGLCLYLCFYLKNKKKNEETNYKNITKFNGNQNDSESEYELDIEERP